MQSKDLIKFKKKYEGFLKRSKSLIINSDWHLKKNRKRFSYKAVEFKHSTDCTIQVIKGLDEFLSGVGGERNSVGVQPYINSIVEIINIHIKRIEQYYIKNDPQDHHETENRRAEQIFQQDIFKSENEMNTSMNKLNIANDYANFEVNLIKDQIASLAFKTVLEEHDEKIKEKIESLTIDWKLIIDNGLYINILKSKIPRWNSHNHFFDQEDDSLQFYISEWNKITQGYDLDGYYFHPWLYFHINYFTISMPVMNERGVLKDIITRPPLRRNEWYFAEIIKLAEEKSQGAAFIFGTRRYSKSTLEASYLLWKAITSPNSEGSITTSNDKDRLSVVSKMQLGLKHLPPFISLHTNITDWEKVIEVGLKTRSKRKIAHFNIRIVNTSDGVSSKSQGGAGMSPVAYIYDESGKSSFLEGWRSAKFGFKAPEGWRAIPIFTGCVCKGTTVWNKKGEKVLIENLTQKEGILGHNGKKVTYEKISYQQEPFEKECVRITTRGRQYIECSVDHPFLTSAVKDRIGGNRRVTTFKEASDLRVGDYIYKPNQINVFQNNKIDNPRLLGLLIGDGYYKGSTVTLSVSDEGVWKYIKSNFKHSIKKQFLTKSGGQYREVCIHKLSKWKRSLNIENDCKLNKKIPNEIFSSDEHTVCEFLAGYFDADGHVYTQKKGNITIGLTSISEKLLQDTLLLLHKVGIQSCINKNTRPESHFVGEFKNSKKYIYTLQISKKRDVIIFNNKIKLHSINKDKTLKTVEKLKINYDKNFLKEGKYIQSKKNPTKKWKDNVENLAQYKIVKIENIGFKKVYNLTAENTNTYLANGFITHNTASNSDITKDAEKVLNNPSKYDFLDMNWDLLEYKVPKTAITWKRRPFPFFVPAQMSYETGLKSIKMKFSDFIGIDSERLDKIEFQETDWEHNSEFILREQKRLEALDKDEYRAYLVFLPIDPEHCFLSANKNPFPAIVAQKHQRRLKQAGNDTYGTALPITLHRDETDNEKIYSKISTKEPAIFPHVGGNIDAPFLLYGDLPKEKPPAYLYYATLDDYKHEKSDGDSVGSFIIRRRNLGMSEYDGKIALTLATRPDPHKDFHSQIHLALEKYNAMLFPENEDMKIKEYFDRRGLSHKYLVEGKGLSQAFQFTNTGNRRYGIQPTRITVPMAISMAVDECKREIEILDEDGNIIDIKLGVELIDDIYLLEEIIKYKDNGGNYDRLVSFYWGCLYEEFLNTHLKLFPKHKQTEEERTEQIKRVSNHKKGKLLRTKKRNLLGRKSR